MKTILVHKRFLPLLLLAVVMAGAEQFATVAQAQSSLDFGDAPVPYPTLVSSNGARHTATGPLLGALRDTENDGLPNAFALGDDSNGQDDEDGVVFLSAVVPGQIATVQVTVANATPTARIDAWLDFDANGSWAEAIDHIFTSRLVTNGVNILTFPVPASAKLGSTFARFRISTAGDLSFTGAAQNGEVEDYQVGILAPMDFGDAPTNNYPTLLVQNGARHRIINNFMLGTKIDSEPDGQPNPNASGDDINPAGANDEDGITFTSSLIAGSSASVQVVCTMNAGQTGKLNAWIDFNRDGDWNDAGEQIFTDVTVANGAVNLTFPVPSSALGGPTFARFRLSVNGKIGPGGFAPDGEVEDYQVNVTQALDYGDAPSPYPTLLAQNGARHVFTNSFCLGTSVDGEVDGLPDPNAKGDDTNGTDDEDGVTFTSSIVPGSSATVQVYLTGSSGAGGPAGFLNAWMDFNRDGDWADAGEQIFTNAPLFPGVNSLGFFVPAAANQGSTFARFRLNHQGGLSFTGPSPDGEVEDYQVNISPDLDFGDAPKPYPTLLADNGARHGLSRSIHLGAAIDSEPDGQPNATATGDDLSASADEDGVNFTSALVPGAPATVQVFASVPGVLHAWIDFNANGTWADAGEKIFNGVGLAAGNNSLGFNVPVTAKTGRTFARFRFTTQTGFVDFVGLVPDGEVEDYQVSIIPDRERCDLACEGFDFWLTFPGNYAPDTNNPVRAELCIVGAGGIAANVSIPGLGFTTNVIIPASQQVHVPLPVPADLGDLNDAVTNRGIHVTASGYVSVFAFNLVHYTSDSYLALPTPALGLEYIVLGFGNVHSNVPPLNGSQFAFVASESNTLVTVTPSVATLGHPAGLPFNLVLQPGDCYQLRNTNDTPADLSGTLISANRPIAVFGSHQCANIPSSNVWFADYIVEQLLPVDTWGNDFYTAPLATRNGDTFRVLASQDATTLFYNGVPVTVLNKGKFIQFVLSAGARISADKPILVAQYANSSDYDGVVNADPFMCQVQATRHYNTSYLLCTPTNDFPANYINIIAPTASTGTVQIDGVPVGAASFTVIAGSAYSYARPLVSAGRHFVTGGAPFAASVYGWAEYESYGHPACFFFGDIVPPRVNSPVGSITASVDDYPNTPGFVPAPDLATGATVDDNCSPQLPPPTQSPRPGVLVPPGINTITLSVADASGNIGQSNVTFTVLDPSPVVIDCPSNIVVNCTSSSSAVVNFQVTAHTTYDPNVPVVSTPPSGSLFPPGTNVVTSMAVSPAGQSNSCTFTVTVICAGTLQVTRNPALGTLTLTWGGSPGTLLQSSNVTGPWLPVASGVNSFETSLSGPRRFFRVLH